MCPYKDCMQVVIGLGEHLQKSHNLQPSSEYYKILNSAKFYKSDELPCSIVKSPQKKFGLTDRCSKRTLKQYCLEGKIPFPSICFFHVFFLSFFLGALR